MTQTKPSYTGHRERLRKKFLQSGPSAFHDHEILEFLLTYAIPRKDTKRLAWDILKRFGTFSRVLDAKPEDLITIDGIGENSAVFFPLLREAMRRYYLGKLLKKDAVKCPRDVLKYCEASLEGEPDEIFEVLYLSVRNKVMSSERLFTGTIDRTAVYPRKVIEKALKNKAAGLIFAHNHPSGEVSPSREDEIMTKELNEAAKAVGITVHDHIIIGVGKDNYYSYREHGLIK